MKPLRVVALIIVFAGIVYLVTDVRKLSNAGGSPETPSSLGVTRPEHVALAEASGRQPLDPDEQLNVTVYKKALPSVVNITSTAVTFDFFYGPVPQQGAGSGFVIDG